MKNSTIPQRSEVAPNDQWNLTLLFKSEEEWEKALADAITAQQTVLQYREDFTKPNELTAHTVLECLQALEKMDRITEKAGRYAFLMKSGDEGNTKNIERFAKFTMTATDLAAKTSWLIPSLLQISEKKIRNWINPTSDTGDAFAPYRVFIEKQLRLKTHTLSDAEEKLLSMLSESADTAQRSFSALTNVDMSFGTVTTKEGTMPLTQSSYSQFLLNSDRNIRKTAYTQFYAVFDKHKNTLASLYTGKVQHNIAIARIRGYSSAREYALYPDKVPAAVYDNLIETVHNNLNTLHEFYALMQKTLGVEHLRHYDVYMPLVHEVRKQTSYAEAVDMITSALQPLGAAYTDTLRNGLLNGWVDRYENKGKRAGAFSAGGFDSEPYILMNYKEDVIRDVFTLAHEGGHSMHSWYSSRNNPFLHYQYTIFEAEVASTFNEELLFRYLLKHTHDAKMKAYLLSVRITDILATLYRQTMFAEYEFIMHSLVENGTPLTIANLRSEYKKLLETYFGTTLHFEECSSLEGLRIPHFYNSFYVYKYATGISASLALADRVYNGGKSEREEYFKFLASGGSRYPIESLKGAGVDMTTADPVQAACKHFAGLVTQLEAALVAL